MTNFNDLLILAARGAKSSKRDAGLKARRGETLSRPSSQDQARGSLRPRPDHKLATKRIPGTSLVGYQLAGRDRDGIANLGKRKWLEVRLD